MIDVKIVWPVWWILAALVLVAWLSLRARVKESIRRAPPTLDDDAVRRIEEYGTITTDEDEPLDLDEIRKEESLFWDEERWDEAEEL